MNILIAATPTAMWKSAKQALDPKALFSADPHAQRVQAQITPAASGERRA